MPHCPICGTEVREGAGFCPKCLRRLMAGKTPEAKSKKKLIGIMLVALCLAAGATAMTCYEYPRIQEGRTYWYCSQLDHNYEISLETRGKTWTAGKKYNPDRCY